MGIHKEVRKLFGSSVLNYVISARTAQGFEEYKDSTLQERQDIIARWREHKTEYQNSKQILMETRRPEGQETGRLSPRGFLQTRHLSFEERKRLHEERKHTREEERYKIHSKDGRRSCPFCSRIHPHTHTPRANQTTPVVMHPTGEDQGGPDDTNLEFERAIHASVAATSHGDAEQDMMIERAIRASVKELQRAGGNTNDSEALSRAIQASIAKAGRGRADESPHQITMTDEYEEYQAQLERAIQESMSQPSQRADPDADIDTDDDEAVKLAIEKSKEAPAVTDVDSDEDENIKAAIEKSKEAPSLEADVDTDEDEDVKLALEKSKSEHMEKLTRAQTEEEIVLEYVKKQSLAEEELKRRVTGKAREAEDADSKADEEALMLAIEESLKHSGRSAGEASGSGSASGS